MNVSELIDRNFGSDEKEHAVFFFKDATGHYRYVNETLLQLLSHYFNHEVKMSDIINKQDIDIFPEECAEFFVSFDKRVRESRSQVQEYETFKINKTQQIYAVAVKKPIYENGDFIGILGKTRYLNVFTVKGKMVILSQRELDVLVHIVFGISAKQIARTLKISRGSVSTYIMRIKVKLHVETQVQLIEMIQKHVLAAYILKYLSRLMHQIEVEEENPKLASAFVSGGFILEQIDTV